MLEDLKHVRKNMNNDVSFYQVREARNTRIKHERIEEISVNT